MPMGRLFSQENENQDSQDQYVNYRVVKPVTTE